jgi:hypothetical protein
MAKGPGIINPSLIKRRVPDPSLIPEYGAPYVPITQDTNSGDTGQNPDGDPKLSGDASTTNTAIMGSPNLTPGIVGTDYHNAARNLIAGGTDPNAGTDSNADPNHAGLIIGHMQDGPSTDPDDVLLTVNTLQMYVTDLDTRCFTTTFGNMSRNISRVFANMSQEHCQTMLEADQRHRQMMVDKTEEHNRNTLLQPTPRNPCDPGRCNPSASKRKPRHLQGTPGRHACAL